jgi:tetratricopeptide (TPR) repeat protein
MAEVFANRGDAKLQMGDLVGTIADCDEALRIKPGDFKSTRIRRRAMALNGDIDGLTADYGDASRSDSDEANFLYSLGLAKFINGDRNGAKSDIERSIELDPDQVDPYLTLGSIFIFRGNIIEARKAYEQALLLAKKQGMSEEMIANIEVSLDKIDRGVFGEDEDPPNTPS